MTRVELSKEERFAVYAITRNGVDIALRLKEVFVEKCLNIDLFASSKVLSNSDYKSFNLLQFPMQHSLAESFRRYRCHIFIMSVGATVRIVSNLLQDKTTDPAVISIDDKAKFVISVLSGHIGKGNLYTKEIAGILGAQEVITTASDVNDTLQVDILGRELGFSLDSDLKKCKGAASDLVNDKPVAIVQECGESSFWPDDRNFPKNVHYFTKLDNCILDSYSSFLWISDRCDVDLSHKNLIVYRPKSLVLGIGCDRDFPPNVMHEKISEIMGELGLSIHSIKMVTSITNKKDEAAIHYVGDKYKAHLKFYEKEELEGVDGIKNPSSCVKKHVGVTSVSEASCLKGADVSSLLLEKQKIRDTKSGKNMTLAIARVKFIPRLRCNRNLCFKKHLK